MEQFILWLSLSFVTIVLLFLAREDYYHLSRPARKVHARVVGHRSHHEDGANRYAALLEFSAEHGKKVQVNDSVYSPLRLPETGALVEVTYPNGMPERARINRPWLRGGIYLVLLYLFAVLVGRLVGWLDAGSGNVAGL